MNQNIKSFQSFLNVAFPTKDPFLRKELGWFHNFIKWVAIRCAYVLYRLGFTANSIDLVGLFLLFPAYYFLYISLIDFNLYLFLASYFTILLVLAIDFMDGVLAKVNKYEYAVGNDMDNLCPDVIKYASYLIIGIITNSAFYFISSLIVCIIIHQYVNKTEQMINNEKIKNLLFKKYSLTSFRLFVCLLVPLFCFLHIVDIYIISYLAQLFVFVIFIISLFWINISFKIKNKK